MRREDAGENIWSMVAGQSGCSHGKEGTTKQALSSMVIGFPFVPAFTLFCFFDLQN